MVAHLAHDRHMESMTKDGWADFQSADFHAINPTDTCWEMMLEDGKRLSVWWWRDHPNNLIACAFPRDVTLP